MAARSAIITASSTPGSRPAGRLSPGGGRHWHSRLPPLSWPPIRGSELVHSYVSADKKRSFCVYDAPSPEVIRSVGARNGVPVDAIHDVSVLDPYFFH